MGSFVVRDVLGWGFGLWLFGYILGLLAYPLVPREAIGWAVTPFGFAATVLALWLWVRPHTLNEAVALAAGWTILAVVCDYVFIVKLFSPPDGYYKLDVYLYYALTFLLPLGAYGLLRGRA